MMPLTRARIWTVIWFIPALLLNIALGAVLGVRDSLCDFLENVKDTWKGR